MSTVPTSSTPSKRILVCGVGPLPPESPDRLSAPGLRVWGIARELVRAGHAVRLMTIEYKGRPIDEVLIRDLEFARGTGEVSLGAAVVASLNPLEVVDGNSDLGSLYLEHARAFKADAVVGCMDMVNRELTVLPPDIPLWCDYFGDPMAERQMLAYHYGDDDVLTDQWQTYSRALCRADRVSGCSRRQAGALLGEMAALGRLNQHTALESLVSRFDPWIEPIPPCAEPGPFLRGVHAPADAYILIQTGGFNTWLDIDTMFGAIEQAMKADPQIHFAATGGGLKGHNEWAFDRFVKLVEASSCRERFHFLGWVPLGQVPRVIAECDLGINIDLPSPEGWLGTRNRLMDWLLGGVPVLSTMGTELVEELAEHGLIRAVDQGDAALAASAIIEMKRDQDSWKRKALEAADYLRVEHASAKCLAPLLEWARDPKPAGDQAAWAAKRAKPPLQWSLANAGSDGAIRLERAQSRLRDLTRELDILEGSALVRFANALRRKGSAK